MPSYFSLEILPIFPRHFSWYSFLNSWTLFRIPTGICPRFNYFSLGFFLENLLWFLNSHRFVVAFFQNFSQSPSLDFCILPKEFILRSLQEFLSEYIFHMLSRNFRNTFQCCSWDFRSRSSRVFPRVTAGAIPGIDIRSPPRISKGAFYEVSAAVPSKISSQVSPAISSWNFDEFFSGVSPWISTRSLAEIFHLFWDFSRRLSQDFF